jgi:hypothetical protein
LRATSRDVTRRRATSRDGPFSDAARRRAQAERALTLGVKILRPKNRRKIDRFRPKI